MQNNVEKTEKFPFSKSSSTHFINSFVRTGGIAANSAVEALKTTKICEKLNKY
jgi:hypothetical protein